MELSQESLRYIDKIAPLHHKTSCSDEDHYNAGYREGDTGCLRCTLLEAADPKSDHLPADEAEED